MDTQNYCPDHFLWLHVTKSVHCESHLKKRFELGYKYTVLTSGINLAHAQGLSL